MVHCFEKPLASSGEIRILLEFPICCAGMCETPGIVCDSKDEMIRETEIYIFNNQ